MNDEEINDAENLGQLILKHDINDAFSVRARSEWISVEDALPEDHGIFLTACQSGAVLLHTLNIEDGWSNFGKDKEYWNTVITHWMPLPEPPK